MIHIGGGCYLHRLHVYNLYELEREREREWNLRMEFGKWWVNFKGLKRLGWELPYLATHEVSLFLRTDTAGIFFFFFFFFLVRFGEEIPSHHSKILYFK